MVGVPVLSVQFNRSILSVQAGVPGSRSRQAFMACVGWRLAVGWRLVGGWLAVVVDNKRAILRWHHTMKRQKRLPILKTPGHRAQKPRFCAPNTRTRGFRSQKAHKNLDFVLEKPENGGSEGQKRTKTSILCSKRPKMGVPEAKKAQKPRFCAREEGDLRWEEKILASESATVAFLQSTAHTSKMQIPHNQIINFYQLAR